MTAQPSGMSIDPHRILSILLLAWPLGLVAQDGLKVATGTYVFSSGLHPTFTVDHFDTDARSVEDHWRKVLKGMSLKVGGRKELIGMAARVPEISADTLRILVKAVQPRGAQVVILHVAFLSTSGYVGVDSDSSKVRACRSFVHRHALSFDRERATKALQAAERTLDRYTRDLALLRKDHQRATEQREKAWARDTTAIQDQERLTLEVANKEVEVAALEARVANEPSEEDRADLKDAQKELGRLRKSLGRAAKAEAQAKRRATALDGTLVRNEQAQVTKEADIVKQAAEVERLRERLDGIH
jgi:hypothetical protein